MCVCVLCLTGGVAVTREAAGVVVAAVLAVLAALDRDVSVAGVLKLKLSRSPISSVLHTMRLPYS